MVNQKIRIENRSIRILETVSKIIKKCTFLAHKISFFLETKGKDDCFPDYAGPCYEDGDCCDVASGTQCSNFICRPTKGKHCFSLLNHFPISANLELLIVQSILKHLLFKTIRKLPSRF